MKRVAIVGAAILVTGVLLLWAWPREEAGPASSAGGTAAPAPAAETLAQGPGVPGADPAAADAVEEPPPAGAAEEGAAPAAGAPVTEPDAGADPSAGRPRPAAEAAAGRPADAEPVPQEPDTDAILRRSSAAYESLRSLRAQFTMRLVNRLLGTTTESEGTLFQVNPDRFLMRFSEPEGDVIVSDGRHFWLYYPSVNARQVIRSPAGGGGAGAVDLRAQFIGDATRRFRATYEGGESVAGRPAHVLTLVPRTEAGYETLKVWIDREDHLVRRFEIREENGNLRRVELRGLERNPSLSPSLFEFEPPADARIIDRG